MKYKYTFLRTRLYYDEILVPYLEKMSKKGWNLVSMNTFFKFEKTPQTYKYQVDYNPLTDEYLETLHYLGYEHVCCVQDMHIYRNLDLNAEDLSSDEDILCETKLKLFKPWMIIFCLFSAIFFYGVTKFLSWLYRYTLGSLLLNLDMYFISLLLYACSFLCVLGALSIFIKRSALKKRTYSYQKLKYLDGIVQLVTIILAVFTILIFFVLKMNRLSTLLKIGGYLIITMTYVKIVNTRIPLIKDTAKKKIIIIMTVVIYVGIFNLYGEIDFSNLDKQEVTITLPKNKKIDVKDSNLLVDITTFNQKIGYDQEVDEPVYSYEGYYQCANTFISKNIFKELVVEHEREERMPSGEEINKITDEKGSWSSDEVKYDTYQNVLKEYKSKQSKYFDTVIEIGQYKLGIKEKNILVVYDEDIDYFYSHYLNLIKK